MNVLLTGLPRSGTTLACELLNLVPNTVALDEPLTASMFTAGLEAGPPSLVRRGFTKALDRLVPTRGGAGSAPDHDVVVTTIERFCNRTRRSISERGVAPSRHVDGKVLGRKVADHYTASGLRAKLAERGEITIAEQVSPGFLLVVKHTSAFAALLPTLVNRFDVFALVRNPLAVLSSWQTVPFPPQEGHVQMGEALDRSLRNHLARIDDRIDRQFHLLAWFFARFRDGLPARSVLRYEDLCASGGATLAAVTPGAASLSVPLENRNKGRPVCAPEVTAALGRRLLATDGPWRHFYSQDSIGQLIPH